MNITNEMILFSILWSALMMIFLLGDVLRIFAGDFTSGEMDGKKVSPKMWLVAAVMMVIPIIMVVLNVMVPTEYMKWPNIVLSIGFLLMNLAGIKDYKIYDQFLLLISFLVNFLVIYLSFIIK